MFSRSRLSSNYKSYVKNLQTLKDNVRNTKDLKINKRCENMIQSIASLECKQCIKSMYNQQSSLLNNKHLGRYKKLIYNVQSTLSKNFRNKDNESLSEEHVALQKKEIADQPNAFAKPSCAFVNNKYIQRYTKVLYNLKSAALFKSTHSNNKSFFQYDVLQNKIKKVFIPSLSAAAIHVVDKTPLSETPKVIEPIPEPPPIPEESVEIVNQLNNLGEPTFASLGLGGWSPIGIVQNSFEYLHITLGVPWWGAIVIGTIVIRLCMFPLVIIAQRNAAKMNNYMPQLQVLQVKMSEARQCGNQLEVARYSQELMLFMKEKNLNPLKNMVVPLAQMPVFISFFMGLRQMANVPVESLRDGGLFWFQDLTVPDQYFALPIITSLTLWATIELGTDSARLSSQNLQTMKYVLRALPLFILPFTVNFPGAILCYWVSTNFISLLQVGFLRIPAVREYFRIEALLKHNPEKLPVKNKGFVSGIKDSWTNLKISKELEERRRLDEMQFQRAGKGPVLKTYKYDPTKQTSKNPHAVSAKER